MLRILPSEESIVYQQLCEDAPHGPDVHTLPVMRWLAQEFRCSVPPGKYRNIRSNRGVRIELDERIEMKVCVSINSDRRDLRWYVTVSVAVRTVWSQNNTTSCRLCVGLYRQRNTRTQRRTDTRTNERTDRQTDRQKHRHTGGQADRRKHSVTWTLGRKNGRTDTHTDRYTDT